MLYLFHGEDDLSRDEYVRSLLERVDDPMGDLNQSRLDPAGLTFAGLRHACDTPPFLSDRRVVLVTGLLQKLAKGQQAFVEQFLGYLPTIPEYTRLFLLEDAVDKRLTLWKRLNEMADRKPPTVFIKEFALPNERQMVDWLQQRAQRHGGQMSGQAARLLASVAGGDVRLLDQEVRKLVTYAGEDPVTPDDVRALVSYAQEATIWELVDAVGGQRAAVALTAAERILRDDPGKAIYLHIMITRQIRLLLQVAELTALGRSPQQMQAELKMSRFVLDKVRKQVPNFTVERLVAAYDQLLEADIALKSGADQALTLNLLIVALAGRRAA